MSDPHPDCCPTASAQLKLYQTMIFLIPVCLVFIVLYFFYLCWRRIRARARWSASSLQRSSAAVRQSSPRVMEMGLMKEFREMLPIIVFKESFAIKDTQCSVCLGDYQAEDKLQLIPMCGHSFHMDCIGSWLSSHSTCPLCRLSLIPAAKTENQAPLGNTEIEERAPQDSIETEESQNSVVEDDHRHCRETDDSFDIEAVGASSAEQEKNMRDHS